VFLWVLCVGWALIALSRGDRRLAATFFLAIAGSGLLSVTLKAIVGHARPTDALITAHEASFPSGHLLSGAVVYGLFASLLLDSHARRWVRAFGTALLLLLIVGIGISRVYLGVHWPSDLLGSLALALVCLALLLFFLHYERPLRIDGLRVPLRPSIVRIIGIALLITSLLVGAFMMRNTKIASVGPPPPSRPVPLSALIAGLPPDVPRYSEGLIGEKMEPISLVLVGSKEQIIAAFQRAGWTLADLPTPVRVVREGLAALANRPDPSGPATPAFLADRPQTLTFEKPDPTAPGIRRRHHARVWQTPYCLEPGCQPIWVATASFDVGVELSKTLHLPTHRIDPNIDAERALIVADLTRARAKVLGTTTVVPPFRGTNAAGDAFTTDGRAAILGL
jgi:undecaprenyl-diphosphatase